MGAMGTKFQIFLVNEHTLICDSLAALLNSEDMNFELQYISDQKDAIDLVNSDNQFDIIIMDLCMPGMTDLLAARKMMNVAKGVPIVLMASHSRATDIEMAYKIGIKGYLTTKTSGKSLGNILRLVASGETYFPADMLSTKTSSQTSNGYLLTRRESDVLSQLRQGSFNKEIAYALGIAETTVKLHIRSLSSKLSARNRTDIVIRAINAGLA